MLMARICVVINHEHSVQAHDVVVDGLLCAVIVVPESTHLFPWIAVAAKRVEAGVAIRVKIVFPATAREEVSRETVALGTVVPVMQVDRNLRMAEGIVAAGRRAVAEPHDCGFAISIQDCWAWIDTIESPDIRWTKVGVESMRAGLGFQFGRHVSRGELSPALMVHSRPFTRTCVGCLLGLRAQRMVYRRKRNR